MPLIPVFIPVLLFTACHPTPKSGVVAVPTVTKNALSGVYDLSPKHPTTKLYYEELGEGEPLILLHAHTVDRRMWDDVFFKLAKKYRVIRYDLRGYGKSDMPEVGFGFLQADDLCNFMDALHIKKAHLAGLSLGGNDLGGLCGALPRTGSNGNHHLGCHQWLSRPQHGRQTFAEDLQRHHLHPETPRSR